MKSNPITFYEMMRASHMKRWHIINTVGQQNVAEHQWNVTVIGLELWGIMIGGEPPAALILALMFHDAPEIRTGDIPTPGKEFIRSALSGKIDGDLFEQLDNSAMPTIPYSDRCPTDEECVILEMADVIEAAWWIRENGVGTHAKTVADRLWGSLCGLAHQNDWVNEVNAVLESLGMPYVPKGSYISPP